MKCVRAVYYPLSVHETYFLNVSVTSVTKEKASPPVRTTATQETLVSSGPSLERPRGPGGSEGDLWATGPTTALLATVKGGGGTLLARSKCSHMAAGSQKNVHHADFEDTCF